MDSLPLRRASYGHTSDRWASDRDMHGGCLDGEGDGFGGGRGASSDHDNDDLAELDDDDDAATDNEGADDGDVLRARGPALHVAGRAVVAAAAVQAAPRRPPLAREEVGELGVWRRRLLRFLSDTCVYDPTTVLARLPPSDLYEERAAVLRRLGQVRHVHVHVHVFVNVCVKGGG
jgi:hypothetical protein